MFDRHDLTGTRIGRLYVVAKAPSQGGCTMWSCICDCGGAITIRTKSLKRSPCASCGCYVKERQIQCGKEAAVHGHNRKGNRSPTYSSYMSMLERTCDANSKGYAIYSALGIGICDRWKNGEGEQSGFECFLSDMGERPTGTTLDRIDGGDSYRPGNCRWADLVTQNRNRRTTKLTQDQVEAMRRDKQRGDTATAIARRYGVCISYASEIVRGQKRAA